MKKEIKRTPITFKGEDGFEVLIEDTEIWPGESCRYCIYDNWDGWIECLASCETVHGCGSGTPTYFQFIK